MPPLRIVSPNVTRLLDNYPRRNDPARLSTLRIVNSPLSRMTPHAAVALAGTVRNEAGLALAGRTVRVFDDQGMHRLLGSVATGVDGSWSLSVPGCASSRFVAVAQGETGETATVYINL